MEELQESAAQHFDELLTSGKAETENVSEMLTNTAKDAGKYQKIVSKWSDLNLRLPEPHKLLLNNPTNFVCERTIARNIDLCRPSCYPRYGQLQAVDAATGSDIECFPVWVTPSKIRRQFWYHYAP